MSDVGKKKSDDSKSKDKTTSSHKLIAALLPVLVSLSAVATADRSVRDRVLFLSHVMTCRKKGGGIHQGHALSIHATNSPRE